MLLSPKKWSVIGLLVLSSQAIAGTASFSGVVDGGNNFNQFSVTQDGMTINVSGWSDTVNDPVGAFDDVIERAKDLDKYNGGWAMENADEPGNYCNTNGHSADNFGNCDYIDYDFFMLEFDEAVSLTSATFSWINGSASQNQVSIVSLNETAINGNGGNINGLTWDSINSSYSTGSGYAQVKNNGSYYIDNVIADTNETLQASKMWLIGAFNSVFGGNSGLEGNDGFKLASVGFNVPTPDSDIPEPSTLAIFGLALVGLVSKRRKF